MFGLFRKREENSETLNFTIRDSALKLVKDICTFVGFTRNIYALRFAVGFTHTVVKEVYSGARITLTYKDGTQDDITDMIENASDDNFSVK